MRTVMIRRVCAFLTAAVLLLGAVPALGETYPFTAYATGALNLRQQPNSSAKVLATIPAGDMAVVTGESGSYYIAVYEGVQGYALKQYLKTSAGSTGTAAVTPTPSAAGASSASACATAAASLREKPCCRNDQCRENECRVVFLHSRNSFLLSVCVVPSESGLPALFSAGSMGASDARTSSNQSNNVSIMRNIVSSE